jgi:hypothetical protein
MADTMQQTTMAATLPAATGNNLCSLPDASMTSLNQKRQENGLL